MKIPFLNPIRYACLGLALLALWTAPALAVVESEPEPEPPARGEPTWLSRSNKEEAAPPGDYRHAALRSIAALLLIIGALMVTHHWLRRRFATEQPAAGSRLKVLSRLRLGARQELVVIEWEGDQMVLGMGPSFIQALHTRRESKPKQANTHPLEETGYGGR